MIPHLKILVGAALLIGLAWLSIHIEGRGYQRAEHHYTKLLNDQAEANRRAARKAWEDYTDELNELTLKHMELDDVLNQIDEEATAAPGSSELALPADSMRRLNRIR